MSWDLVSYLLPMSSITWLLVYINLESHVENKTPPPQHLPGRDGWRWERQAPWCSPGLVSTPISACDYSGVLSPTFPGFGPLARLTWFNQPTILEPPALSLSSQMLDRGFLSQHLSKGTWSNRWALTWTGAPGSRGCIMGAVHFQSGERGLALDRRVLLLGTR